VVATLYFIHLVAMVTAGVYDDGCDAQSVRFLHWAPSNKCFTPIHPLSILHLPIHAEELKTKIET
jgi:hypothetical protein